LKQQFLCEVCGMIFGKDEKEESILHEITHLDLEGELKTNLLKALEILDEKYNCKSEIVDIRINVEVDYDDMALLEYHINISSTAIQKKIKSVETRVEGVYKAPSTAELVDSLEKKYYMPYIMCKFEGIFTADSCDSVHGYCIGEIDINTIYCAFADKKVRIEIIE